MTTSAIVTASTRKKKTNTTIRRTAKQNRIVIVVVIQSRILLGEWMVARHSIPYGQLPNYFVAFDSDNISASKFVSTQASFIIMSRDAAEYTEKPTRLDMAGTMQRSSSVYVSLQRIHSSRAANRSKAKILRTR